MTDEVTIFINYAKGEASASNPYVDDECTHVRETKGSELISLILQRQVSRLLRMSKEELQEQHLLTMRIE